MAALTDNKFDVYNWIKKVIASCKNINHTNSAERLIQNLWRMFNDAQLTSKLQAELDYKIEQLINRINVNE
jgi:hypothetical protein